MERLSFAVLLIAICCGNIYASSQTTLSAYSVYKAAKNNKVRLLTQDSVNLKNDKGLTALHYACNAGNLDAAKLLIDKGADVYAKSEKSGAPIHMACYSGRMKLVQYLIDTFPNLLNFQDNLGMTPLYWAASNDQKEVVSYLLERGADARIKAQDDCTPFMIAFIKGNEDAAKLLVRHEDPALWERLGDDEDEALEVVTDGEPIHRACAVGALKIVQQMVHNDRSNLKKASDEYWGDTLYLTPLHIASSYGHLDIVKYLVENGAEIDAKDSYGRTPLMEAMDSVGLGSNDNGLYAVIGYLISKGAGVYIGDQLVSVSDIIMKHIDLDIARAAGRETQSFYKGYSAGDYEEEDEEESEYEYED